MVSDSSDNLHVLLRRIGNVLGATTRTIIGHRGVIADFQGDSALGFRGRPLPLTDGPLPACRAPLQIQQLFEEVNQKSSAPLMGFRVGIGIATGRAIAGLMTTPRIGVFGPVVNVASWLEGLTKKPSREPDGRGDSGRCDQRAVRRRSPLSDHRLSAARLQTWRSLFSRRSSPCFALAAGMNAGRRWPTFLPMIGPAIFCWYRLFRKAISRRPGGPV